MRVLLWSLVSVGVLMFVGLLVYQSEVFLWGMGVALALIVLISSSQAVLDFVSKRRSPQGLPGGETAIGAEAHLNPHSLPKQVTGLVVASVVVISLYFLGGVLLALMGTFTFLDAWNSGIYKRPGYRALSNLSPMGGASG